jgi:hypothetical protein
MSDVTGRLDDFIKRSLAKAGQELVDGIEGHEDWIRDGKMHPRSVMMFELGGRPFTLVVRIAEGYLLDTGPHEDKPMVPEEPADPADFWKG